MERGYPGKALKGQWKTLSYDKIRTWQSWQIWCTRYLRYIWRIGVHQEKGERKRRRDRKKKLEKEEKAREKEHYQWAAAVLLDYGKPCKRVEGECVGKTL